MFVCLTVSQQRRYIEHRRGTQTRVGVISALVFKGIITSSDLLDHKLGYRRTF